MNSCVARILQDAADWNEPVLALTILFSAYAAASPDYKSNIAEAIRLTKIAQETHQVRWLLQAREFVLR